MTTWATLCPKPRTNQVDKIQTGHFVIDLQETADFI